MTKRKLISFTITAFATITFFTSNSAFAQTNKVVIPQQNQQGISGGAIQQNQIESQTAEKPVPFTVAQVHLINGESIYGKLLNVEGVTITIESDKGYGVLTIPKSDVLMITYPESQINLSRRYGLGYLAMSNIIQSVDNTMNYNLNNISLRTYFNESFILQWLAGFGSLGVKVGNDETDQTTVKYQVFTAGLRAAGVLKRDMNSTIYSGAGVGFISLVDDSRDIADSGVTYSIFLGAELFFISMPNFGFSGEVAFNGIQTERLQRFEISVSPIPNFSVHYYF